MEKILTVVIPSYNMEAYLPKCLGSLVVSSELMDKLEVLVVNDGSKDRTSEIAHEFENKYPQTFKVIDKANGHYGSCVNAGLAVATGTYVKILDADDSVDNVCFSEYLLSLSRLVGCSENNDVIINDFCEVLPSGEIINRTAFNLPQNVSFAVSELKNVEGGWVSIHAIAYRRELLLDISYRQTEGCAYTDTEWFTLPMAYAAKVVYFSFHVMHYTVGRDGQSMEIGTLCRDVEVIARILTSLAQRLATPDNTRNEESYEYAICRCGKSIQFVYRIAMFNSTRLKLKQFDKKIKSISKDIYCAVESDATAKIFGRTYNFVRAFRCCQCHPLLILTKMYKKLMGSRKK